MVEQYERRNGRCDKYFDQEVGPCHRVWFLLVAAYHGQSEYLGNYCVDSVSPQGWLVQWIEHTTPSDYCLRLKFCFWWIVTENVQHAGIYGLQYAIAHIRSGRQERKFIWLTRCTFATTHPIISSCATYTQMGLWAARCGAAMRLHIRCTRMPRYCSFFFTHPHIHVSGL